MEGKPFGLRMMMRIFRYSWEKKISPFGVLRGIGRLGSRFLIRRYMHTRMDSIPDDHFEDMLDYYYQIAMSPGSSEYALQTLFGLGVFAHKPLVNRLEELVDIPISFFYGEHDWMDAKGGNSVKEIYPDGLCKVYVIAGSDHHLYLDAPDLFAQSIIDDFAEELGREAVPEPELIPQTRNMP